LPVEKLGPLEIGGHALPSIELLPQKGTR
jgi:hypothetical protein